MLNHEAGVIVAPESKDTKTAGSRSLARLSKAGAIERTSDGIRVCNPPLAFGRMHRFNVARVRLLGAVDWMIEYSLTRLSRKQHGAFLTPPGHVVISDKALGRLVGMPGDPEAVGRQWRKSHSGYLRRVKGAPMSKGRAGRPANAYRITAWRDIAEGRPGKAVPAAPALVEAAPAALVVAAPVIRPEDARMFAPAHGSAHPADRWERSAQGCRDKDARALRAFACAA
jgi:hypothetical protein